jgi:hypothetical protein
MVKEDRVLPTAPDEVQHEHPACLDSINQTRSYGLLPMVVYSRIGITRRAAAASGRGFAQPLTAEQIDRYLDSPEEV